MIYFDNAATTFPKPKQVINAVNSALTTYSANPGRSGHRLSQQAAVAVYEARSRCASLFGSNHSERVVFTANCTMSLNLALKGLLRPGDRVMTSSLEHNAVMRPLAKLEKSGVKVDMFEVVIGDKAATFRSFLNTVEPDTKLVVCTHASNVIGAVMPIKEIGSFCRERGMIFVVDAAQTAGVLDIDIEDMCIDLLCAAPHKGLYAPMGTGLLIIGDRLPDTLIEGGTGTNSINPIQPAEPPERYESGTLNLPGIAGIAAGVDFVTAKTVKRIREHENTLARQITSGLGRIGGVRLYCERDDENFVPVIPFNIGAMNSVEAAALLDERGIAVRAGLHCAPNAHRRLGTIEQGAVRVCPSAFTAAQDVNKLLNAVDIIAAGNKKYIF